MSVGIAALAEQWGGDATGIGPLADRAPDIANAISEAIAAHDLTVIVGGALVGDHDHARPAVRGLGGVFLFEKVALRPGKPTWFARIGGRLVLGLPGNPASAFVCARLFLRPLIDQMCGRDPMMSAGVRKARTRAPLSANGSRETYLRAAPATDESGQVSGHGAGQTGSVASLGIRRRPSLDRARTGCARSSAGALVDVLLS